MKRRKPKIIKFFQYLLVILIILAVILIVGLGRSSAQFRSFYSHTLAAKASLEKAVSAISAKDLDSAAKHVQAAQADFSAAKQELDAVQSNWLVRHFYPLRHQVDELSYLDQAGLSLSSALGRGLNIVQPFRLILNSQSHQKFSELPIGDKTKIIDALKDSAGELEALQADLDEASNNLNKISKFSVLYPVYKQISDLKDKVENSREMLGALKPWLGLSPVLAGYPDASRFLLLFQNNDELRPTGGFLGVYGVLEMAGGELKTLVTEDTYHLDMPVKDSLTTTPPAVLKTYLKVDKWFLRDSNWSPDWPTAAKDIQFVYNTELSLLKQPQPKLDGVIAITPDLIADLIELTGPITVKGEVYNKDNFQKLLQYNVEVAYKEDNISSWDRKEIINDIVSELKTRLFNLPLGAAQGLVLLLEKNLEEKNILVYLNDPAYENQIANLDWAGKVKWTEGDYLMIVDANLGAFKSDAVMVKDISYSLDARQGDKAKLSLSYRHTGGFDWRTTRYRSYTRVYVPNGSQIIGIKGEENNTLNVYYDKNLDKNVFAFFLTVEPGKEKTIEIEYQLPKALQDKLKADNYSLLVQKQPGRRTNRLNIDLGFPTQSSHYTSDLTADRVFRVETN